MNTKIDDSRVAAVDPEYYWQPLVTVPLGAKVLLLTHGEVAVIGKVGTHDQKYYRAWAPLPKIPRDMK